LVAGALLGWVVQGQLPDRSILSVGATVAATASGYLAATWAVLVATRDPLWSGLLAMRGKKQSVSEEPIEQRRGVSG
jgi:hypothetical protein